MSGYVQRLLDHAARVPAAADTLKPVTPIASPLAEADQRLASPEFHNLFSDQIGIDLSPLDSPAESPYEFGGLNELVSSSFSPSPIQPLEHSSRLDVTPEASHSLENSPAQSRGDLDFFQGEKGAEESDPSLSSLEDPVSSFEEKREGGIFKPLPIPDLAENRQAGSSLSPDIESFTQTPPDLLRDSGSQIEIHPVVSRESANENTSGQISLGPLGTEAGQPGSLALEDGLSEKNEPKSGRVEISPVIPPQREPASSVPAENKADRPYKKLSTGTVTALTRDEGTPQPVRGRIEPVVHRTQEPPPSRPEETREEPPRPRVSIGQILVELVPEKKEADSRVTPVPPRSAKEASVIGPISPRKSSSTLLGLRRR